MSDVFERLVGQERVASLLRQYALTPVHAYLFSGPGGSGVYDAVVAFAASLQCPRHGCGECEVCVAVSEGRNDDVYVAERSGVTWRLEEIREIERVARRRPLGAGYQIVVVEDVELTTTGASPSASALLKTLEEPPARTVFLLTTDEPSLVPDTVVSRCVEVRLGTLDVHEVTATLVGEGFDPLVAAAAAEASRGNLRRARVLVRDDGLASRLARWRDVAGRLDGTSAASARVARELSASLDDALVPLVQLQAQEQSRREQAAREVGLRGSIGRRDLDAQFKREQRRFRQEELRLGLSVLSEVYRTRLLEALDGVGDARATYRVGASLRALDALFLAHRRLATNVDEALLLADVMLSLREF